MSTIIELVEKWKDLIVKVFTDSPLAAAIVTLVAAGAFYWLSRKTRPGKTVTNAFLVLVGWAIAVPVVGFIFTVLGKIWEAIEFLASGAIRLTGSLYTIYARHPLLIIAIVVVGVVAYAAWTWWWPQRRPKGLLRIGSIA